MTSAHPIEIGKSAPNFTLPDLDGKPVKLSDFKGKIVVLEWINEGCPFSRGHYESGNMQSLQKTYTSKGVIWLTINSTRPDHPEAFNSAKSKQVLTEWKSNATTNLMDEDRTVGHLYDAKTTPHMFVIDANGIVRYQGAIDDHRGTDGGKNAHVNYVQEALDDILAGKEVTVTTTTPYGCSVKY
ncbi:MAG TPA: thioredoxin family protein [Candidatus Kapabacteria bacterium]|nr:thioredoxin family protein [Candidatus Kapabacteria bacterium]